MFVVRTIRAILWQTGVASMAGAKAKEWVDWTTRDPNQRSSSEEVQKSEIHRFELCCFIFLFCFMTWRVAVRFQISPEYQYSLITLVLLVSVSLHPHGLILRPLLVCAYNPVCFSSIDLSPTNSSANCINRVTKAINHWLPYDWIFVSVE